LLKGELHRAGALHAVGRDEGFADAAPDDDQAVVAQYHDVLVAEIGQEAGALVGMSPGALIVVIGNVADHLQRILVDRQQSRLLHRHRAAGDRVGMDDAGDFRARPVDRAGDREAAAVDRVLRGFDRIASAVDLDQGRGGDLLIQHAVGVDQEVILRPGHAGGDPRVDQIRPAEPVDEAVAGGEIDPGLPFRRGPAGRGHLRYRHARFSPETNSSMRPQMGPIGKATWPHELGDAQTGIIIVTAAARPAPANQHIDNTTLSHRRALQYSIEFTEQGGGRAICAGG
jgi:hypothetical protein